MTNRYGRVIFCAAALIMAVSPLAWAGDPESIAQDQGEIEISPETSCDYVVAPSSAEVPLPVFVPKLAPGIEFTGGWLFLRPGADNLGFATITTFLPLENPQWAVQTLNPSYQSGFTAGARYVLPSAGKDIRFNWEHLRTSNSASMAVSDPTTQWISPFNQTGPSTSEQANEVGIFHFKAAQGQVGFNYDMANLDVGQTVNIGATTQLRLFAGLSLVQLREQLISTFFNDPNIDPVPPVLAPPNQNLKFITLNNTTKFTGLGPRLGFATGFNLPRGFNFVSQISGALLAGWTQPAQYSFAAVFVDTVNSEQIASHAVPQVVYFSDAKLGLGYTRPFGNGSTLSIECGFKAAVFINPFSTYETSTNVLPLDIGSLSTNSMRHTPSNFTLNGLYLTGNLKW